MKGAEAGVKAVLPDGARSTVGAADQLACNLERGRQIWLRFSLRPLALGK